MKEAVTQGVTVPVADGLESLRPHLRALGFLMLCPDGSWSAGIGSPNWTSIPDLARLRNQGSRASLLLAPFPETDAAPRRAFLLHCPKVLQGSLVDMYTELPRLPRLRKSLDLDRDESWRTGVAACIRAMRRGDASKVVLGRQRRLTLEAEPCPLNLVLHLAARHPGSTVYCVRLADGSLLAGASPEVLLERRGLRLRSDSLAGTRSLDGAKSRGELEQELLASDKDRREQAIVSDSLLWHFRNAGCVCPETEGPTVRRAGQLLHLYSRVQGQLPDAERFWRLLADLHPTPALCGDPRAASLSWIARVEKRPRGLFGGIVGLLEAERAHVAVCIRSIRVLHRSVIQFAGAGILAESDPMAEWLETEAKLQGLARLFPREKG